MVIFTSIRDIIKAYLFKTWIKNLVWVAEEGVGVVRQQIT